MLDFLIWGRVKSQKTLKTDIPLNDSITVYYKNCKEEGNHSFVSPPLPLSHIFILHFRFLFQSLTLSLSPLPHCFPTLLSLFGFSWCLCHTTGLHYVSVTRHYVYARLAHAVMFSKSCAANKAAWSQVSRRPEPLQVSTPKVWLVSVSCKSIDQFTVFVHFQILSPS